jgi:leucyl-tRNA synthetase
MVHSRSFRDQRGKYFYDSEVVERGGEWFAKEDDRPVITQVEKMSKSRNNGIPPEDVVADYGADSLRIYEVFMGPMEDSVLWQTDGIVGVRRFLDRVWRLFARESEPGDAANADDLARLERLLHRTIRKVTEDIEGLQLNTAISQLMIFVNEATKNQGIPAVMQDAFVRLLAPFAPHLAEELWAALGHTESIARAEWPQFDPQKCMEESVLIVVQINGKVRGRITLPRGASEHETQEAARKDAAIARYLDDRQLVKVFFVPDRILNIIVS